MTSKEKIAFVKSIIKERAEISPKGRFILDLMDVIDLEATGGIPDEAPVLLSRSEQFSIIKKLEDEGFVSGVEVVEKDKYKYRVSVELKEETEETTTLDYVKEIILSLAREYEKYPAGKKIRYEVYVGQTDIDEEALLEEYSRRLDALQQLKEDGVILDYSLEARYEDIQHNEYVGTRIEYEIAKCLVDKNELQKHLKELPGYKDRARDVDEKRTGEKTAQKIIHEHTHKFANSIQEKDMVLTHKYDRDHKGELYITKEGDDYFYKGRYLNLTKTSDYYKVFSALYALVSNGGEVPYKALIVSVKSRLPKWRNKTEEEMRKFIQNNLTDKSNGFLRYAGIHEVEDNGKPLIEVVRGSGIVFNNTAG